MSNDNRTQSKTERNTETTEVNESDNMAVTRDERPGHRMLADDVIDPFDFSSTTMVEVVVRPKCDEEAAGGEELQNKVNCMSDSKDFRMMNQFAVDYPTFPVNQRFFHLIQYLKGC